MSDVGKFEKFRLQVLAILIRVVWVKVQNQYRQSSVGGFSESH